MAFGYTTAAPITNSEREERRRQREAAMFGRAGTERSGAVYPLNEKVNLPIDLIDENPDNRKIFNMRHIDEFAESIDKLGFSGVIEVYQKESGRYELISGNRRMLAMKKRGATTIPAVILPMPDEIFKAEKLLASNVYNRELTPLDYARAIEYYIDNVLKPSGYTGDKNEACSKFFLKSVTTIKRYRAISLMIPELQEFTEDEQFPYTAFDKARTFTKEEQYILYDELVKFQSSNPDVKISQTYVEQTINFIKNKRQPQSVDEPTKVSATETKTEPSTPLDIEKAYPSSLITSLREETEINIPREKRIEESSSEETEVSPAVSVLRTCMVQLQRFETTSFYSSEKEEVVKALTELKALADNLIEKNS